MAQSTGDRSRRLPTFASIEEEAAFWDSHDSTEFEDEFEDAAEVRVVPAGTLSAVIAIPVYPETLGALESGARDAGTAPEALARRWIVERLNASKDAVLKD